jgi:uncharacterized protein
MFQRIKNLFAKDTAPTPEPKTMRNHDGAENVLTGMGMLGRDSAASTYFRQDALLTQHTCDAAYSSSGIARRVVDLIVNDALGRGIDCDIDLYKEMERLDVIAKVSELAKLSRLYGGAIMLLIAEDGIEDVGMPLSVNGLKSLAKLVVFDRWECSISSTDYDNDPMSDTYGEIMHYRIIPRNGTPLKVHQTRVIRMNGDYLPPNLKRLNQEWAASALQAVYTGYLNYLTMQGFLPTIAKEFSLTILKISGLVDAYVDGQESKIAKRANDAQASKSMANIMLLDADSEDFSRSIATATGYADLITKGMELLSADAGIPMTMLFGRSPEGMNATGESDLDNWYKNVERYQTLDLQRVINRIVELLEAQSEWTKKPESFDWNWPSLQPLDDNELADVRMKHAQADNIYIQAQAVDPEYIFHARHDGGYNTQLNYTEDAQDEFMQGRESVIMKAEEPETGNEGEL